jgi:hypothetical protein
LKDGEKVGIDGRTDGQADRQTDVRTHGRTDRARKTSKRYKLEYDFSILSKKKVKAIDENIKINYKFHNYFFTTFILIFAYTFYPSSQKKYN